ncbi:MAG: DUF4258 domain-containing protein [Thermodesulfobacteriota bacterium]|nr:DUF4258 domain-containing protein [Thermodesulfobacteriota bacterium]
MIDSIRSRVIVGDYRFTVHGFERCVERHISPDEVKYAILSGEIIEEYPEDKYGPSCLVCGVGEKKRILHVQCSINPVWIITAYDPTLNPDRWDKDFKRRRII